jgi:hypothetical protein
VLILRLLLFTCLTLGATACGSEAPQSTAPQPTDVQWRESKPGARIGSVRAAVVERPGPGRALIEARWENRSGGANCALELVVPDGVVVLEGERVVPLPFDDDAGAISWLVEFPSGRALDAVLRLCAESDDGMRATETSVRLTDAP